MRLILLALSFSLVGSVVNDADAQTLRRAPQSRSSFLGIDGPDQKVGDNRNGRKRVIYDRNGRRDYLRDFRPKDERKRQFCQLHPADNDCIGFRL